MKHTIGLISILVMGLSLLAAPARAHDVKDPVCETYIPRRKAIARGSGPAIRYFCSATCADKYAARS